MRSPIFACPLALLSAPIVLAAEQAPDIQSRLAAVEAAAKSAQSAGDNAWMLVSAALVLMMTGPGLALFYGGLVRRKNVLGSMMHSFILMAVVTVVWAVVGYSLAFGGSSPLIGDLHFAFLNHVGSAPNPDYAPTIPHQTFPDPGCEAQSKWGSFCMKRLRTIGALCALLLLVAAVGYSQAVNATLLGTVTDSSGAIVPNAKVTVTEVNTGANRSGQTNESGNYTFPDMAPGQYAITVEVSGFKKETRKDIALAVNSSTRIDVQLTPGNITETVEVTGAPPLLQTDRADTGAQLEVVQTASLPLGTQRNYQSLLNLVPGTTRATFQHSQFFNAASSLQTEVNGQMRQGNSYQIEGIDNNERTGLLQIMVPPLEAIQAVDVSTSNYEASLGRASGANTNVILKSGTNEFHGAGFEFMRNSALNARNFFDASVGHLAYNYFGGDIGGPIKKNKIFIFGDFLRITDHEANTNLGTIPPGSWRTGDLSSGLTLSGPVVVYDPATGNADGTNRSPFAGNIIPSNRISKIAQNIMNLVPAPNLSGSESAPSNNYFALLPFTKDTNSFDVKVDDSASDKGRLSARFSYSRPVVYQAPVFGLAGGFAQGAFQGTSIDRKS